MRLKLGKLRVDGFTEPRREFDIRYKFGFKVILKGLGCKYRFLQPFLIEFPSNNQICHCFCQIDAAESRACQIYQATKGKWRQIWISFEVHIVGLRVKIEFFYMNCCLIVGCYEEKLEVTSFSLNMNLCLEYQSE